MNGRHSWRRSEAQPLGKCSLHALDLERLRVFIVFPSVLLLLGYTAGCPRSTTVQDEMMIERTSLEEVPGRDDLEREMLRLVNRERERRGLSRLSLDVALVRIARLHSLDMMESDFVGHVSPTTGTDARSSPRRWLCRAGCS